MTSPSQYIRVYWNFEFSTKWLAHKDLFVFGVLECRGKEIFTFEKFLPGGKLVWSFSIFIIWISPKITPKSMFFEKLPFRGQKMIFTPKQKLFQKPWAIVKLRKKWFFSKKIFLGGVRGPLLRCFWHFLLFLGPYNSL